MNLTELRAYGRAISVLGLFEFPIGYLPASWRDRIIRYYKDREDRQKQGK